MSVYKRLYIDVPGIGRLEARPGGSIKLPGNKRQVENADTGPAGFSSEPTHGVIKCTVINKAGISLSQLGNIEDINITVQDDGGKTWLCSKCAVIDPPEMTNGDIPLEIHFLKHEEVT